MKFSQKLRESIQRSESLLCVGLDPDPGLIPFIATPSGPTISEEANRVYDFCKSIIEETSKKVAAFKINTAFFEALGAPGWEVLNKLSTVVPKDSILILDAKRGDIGNTSAKYAEALLNQVGCDAVTLNPLMGLETFNPFSGSDEIGIYALALTSNPGASQYLMRTLNDGKTLGETIATDLKTYSEGPDCKASIGMVVGATQPASAQNVLEAYPNAPLLIPGIGAQGGDPTEWASLLATHHGLPLFNSSRGIIYAGNHDPEHWIDHVLKAVDATKQTLSPVFESCKRLL